MYLTYFDHWCKETLRIKHYFRYADNVVIFASNKEELHVIFGSIRKYLEDLKLEIKPDYQIYNIETRGVDFVGYVFRHEYTLLRKSIKQRLKRLVHLYLVGRVSRESLKRRIASYLGWLKYCNSKRLLYLIEQKTHIHFSNWRGVKATFKQFEDRIVRLVHVETRGKYSLIEFIYANKPYYIQTRNFDRALWLSNNVGYGIIL